MKLPKILSDKQLRGISGGSETGYAEKTETGYAEKRKQEPLQSGYEYHHETGH